jgi:hypothetical protein
LATLPSGVTADETPGSVFSLFIFFIHIAGQIPKDRGVCRVFPLNRSRYGMVARPRLKAFHIPAQYDILGKMNMFEISSI